MIPLLLVFVFFSNVFAFRQLEPAGLNFLVMGDWGGRESYPYTTPSEINTAQGMSRVSDQLQADFVLCVGDNFYSEGVQTPDDPRFNSTFQRVFTNQMMPIPFYLIAGNHDHRGNVAAEIKYTQSDPTGRWRYPDWFYLLEFQFSTGKLINQFSTGKLLNSPSPNDCLESHHISKVAILMIDTVILAGSWDNKEPQPLGSHHPLKQQQLNWLESQLNQLQTTHDWIMVGGHYPIYSVGEHGPTRFLVDNVLPLLRKYGVSVYFNGHDHSLQLIKDHHILFVTSGAVHEIDSTRAHWNDNPHDSVKFHWPDQDTDPWSRGGFVSVQLYNRLLGLINFHDQNGTVLYHRPIRNSNRD